MIPLLLIFSLTIPLLLWLALSAPKLPTSNTPPGEVIVTVFVKESELVEGGE